ncbi:9884_t:CDS:2 [Ambispora gerdemannii]|uniref:9884_t:CDS:1 n=1 Tax=Ambispora gerdemannii TaxID=144530 RepID=A0A9N9GZ34_9GLOM|nr:9884_t:CDS:2 [Ambispora gerdemannii]
MSEINKLKKIDMLSTSSSSIPSLLSIKDNITDLSKQQLSLARNKGKQQTDSEENPHQQAITEDIIKNDDKSKKESRTIIDGTINDQMDRTLTATDVDSIATYSEQIESNLALSSSFITAKSTENQIMNQQQIDIKKLDDLSILFDNTIKYNENFETNFMKFFTILSEKSQTPSDKIEFCKVYKTIYNTENF